MSWFRRVVVALAVAALMMIGLTAPAQADSLACNASGGAVCGKVHNAGKGFVTIYDGKRILTLNPGQSSRNVGMRDVMRYQTNRVHTMQHGANNPVKRNAGAYGVSDSRLTVVIW